MTKKKIKAKKKTVVTRLAHLERIGLIRATADGIFLHKDIVPNIKQELLDAIEQGNEQGLRTWDAIWNRALQFQIQGILRTAYPHALNEDELTLLIGLLHSTHPLMSKKSTMRMIKWHMCFRAPVLFVRLSINTWRAHCRKRRKDYDG